MTSAQVSEPEPRSRGLLWIVVLLVLAGAGVLWGASALTWANQQFDTPLGSTMTSGGTGAQLRPELGPMALASLAAVAAVLATGGLLRRLMGLLVVLAGALLGWRGYQTLTGGWFDYVREHAPAGGTPVSEVSTQPAGPLLMLLGALLLVAAGALTVLRAGRMPAMGAKYSAPGTAKERPSHDSDRQLWNELDAGRDPTAGDDR